MIASWRIGDDATLTSLTEYYGPVHEPATFYPKMDRSVLEAHRGVLEGEHWIEASDRLVIGFQIWILHSGDRTILIDTGVGNGKPRRTPRANRLNTIVPAWMAAAGADFDKVTDVVMTHLHSDHVGWNTVAEGERWVPTFPNAAYHLPRRDYDWFKEFNDSGQAVDGGSFYDSVQPVVDAGRARFVEPGDIVAGCLEATAAFGHTHGHLNFWFGAEGEQVLFCGDVLHHPVQIYRPDWNSIVDREPETALATRAAFLPRAAAARALIAPCHFGPPHCGFIDAAEEGFAFRPAPAGARLRERAESPWSSTAK